jgi:hypothetical protein
MRKNKEQSNGQRKVAIIVAIIAALASVSVPVIPYLIESFTQPSTPVTFIPPTALEAELAKVNVSLTEMLDKESQVRQWLTDEDDLQYQTMAQTILIALAGKRVINPVPLDVLISKYRVALGGKDDTNFPPEKYKDIEKTKTAMFDTWKERHPNFPQMSFDEIVELVK